MVFNRFSILVEIFTHQCEEFHEKFQNLFEETLNKSLYNFTRPFWGEWCKWWNQVYVSNGLQNNDIIWMCCTFQHISVSRVVCVLIGMVVGIDIRMHDMHVFQVEFVLHRWQDIWRNKIPTPISISLSKTPHLFYFIFSTIPNEYHMKIQTKWSYIVKSDRRCEMILGGYHRI